jgi:hypothetical protein
MVMMMPRDSASGRLSSVISRTKPSRKAVASSGRAVFIHAMIRSKAALPPKIPVNANSAMTMGKSERKK